MIIIIILFFHSSIHSFIYFVLSFMSFSMISGSSNDAGGFANVEFSPGCSVEGCVYTITEADLSMLDNCMGYPKV